MLTLQLWISPTRCQRGARCYTRNRKVAFIFHNPDRVLHKKIEDALHRLVFNIPGTGSEIPANLAPDPTLPDGTVPAKSTRRTLGYGTGSVCPRQLHIRTLRTYIKLNLGPYATRADVLNSIDGHILGRSVLVGPLSPQLSWRFKIGLPSLAPSPNILSCHFAQRAIGSWIVHAGLFRESYGEQPSHKFNRQRGPQSVFGLVIRRIHTSTAQHFRSDSGLLFPSWRCV